MQNYREWGKLKTMSESVRHLLPLPRFATNLVRWGWVMPWAILGLTGCDLGAANSTTANVTDSYNFSGLYQPADGHDTLVTPASSAKITWIRLLHYGQVLEAYDSAHQTWRGQISGMDGSAASFTLRGRTTAGIDVDIAGVLRYAERDGQSQATLEATWVEPNFTDSLFAWAIVAPPSKTDGNDATADTGGGGTTNGGGGGGDGGDQPDKFYINPEIRWFIPSGGISANYEVIGGTPPYTWTVSDPSLGTLAPTTGKEVTYTTTKIAGTNTITVIDAQNNTTTARAEYH